MHDANITSVSNSLIKEVRALTQKKTRDARGEFLCEGIQIVMCAAQNGASLKMLLVAPDLLKSQTARDFLRTQERAGARIIRVSRAVFESFAERENPSGLAAVVKMTPRALETFRADADSVFVALYQISNPGNLGTILRTADAVSARGVIIIGAATDPYAPATVNASRGALFAVPFVRAQKTQSFLDWARSQNLRVVTTSDRTGQDFWRADLRAPLVLVLGNEGEGLPDDLLRAGEAVRIPMFGKIDSLNLGAAASVLLYEITRQRWKR